jgi:hypothetical protein
MSSPFLCHDLVGGVPSRGTHIFIFARKERNWCPSVSRGRATSSCKTSYHDPLQWSEMGLPAGLSSCPTAKTNQEWLWRNFRAFIGAEDWPSGSPDPNPQDYKLWAHLEDMACQKRHTSLDSPKRSIVKAARGITLEMVRAAIAEWPERLNACAEAEGGHFECGYCK